MNHITDLVLYLYSSIPAKLKKCAGLKVTFEILSILGINKQDEIFAEEIYEFMFIVIVG